MLNPSHLWRFVPAICAVASLYGCVVGPDFHEPAAGSMPTYTAAPQPTATRASAGPGGAAQNFVDAATIGGAWWQAFGSDALNRLVQQALDDSPTLLQARMKLTQAQEDYRAQAGATELPQLDARASATRERVDPSAFGLPNIKQPGPFTLYSASVTVSYAFDFFGANRRALEGLAAQVNYQQFELDAARLALAGNVVTTALQLASLARQIALTEAILDAQTRQFQVIEERYAQGGVSRVDMLNQRTQLQQTRASLSPLRNQLARANHQLAVYLGGAPSERGPDELSTNGDNSLDLDTLILPTELPLTLPSTLARQRPDIRASEALLHQANANLGVATANLYPQIMLSGSAGSERTNVSDLLKGLNVWSLGAGLTQPLFHGGQLHARRRSAEAAYAAALASYRQTVLQGLQEVADALRALQHDGDELQSRDEAGRSAHESREIASGRYAVGGISHLALLDSQRQELQTTLDRVKVQAQRYLDTAALYQALGARP
jgi:NodT family efflux transporter outer membrane factor (OMF) lipoprotein